MRQQGMALGGDLTNAVVVGDDGGIFFFPPELVEGALEYADESAAREAFQLELLLNKEYRFRDIYPLGPELQAEFDQLRRN